MRHLKFVISALAILLAGAMAAGFAARSVAAPKAGEVISAGVVSVPSVLGQSAEEVLFYPWPLYDLQALSPLSDEDLDYVLQYMPHGSLLTDVTAIGALGAHYDEEALIRAQVSNLGDDTIGRRVGALIFVKDFPAVLPDSGVPVTLDYALSDSYPLAVSYLMRPQNEAVPTEEQRQSALNRVKDDLAGLLWYHRFPSYSQDYNDLMIILNDFYVSFDGLGLSVSGWMLKLSAALFQQYGADAAEQSFDETLTIIMGSPSSASTPEAGPCPALDELLELGQGGPVDVQLISTPQQVVLLLVCDGMTFGVYYDILLERYSGFGFSF